MYTRNDMAKLIRGKRPRGGKPDWATGYYNGKWTGDRPVKGMIPECKLLAQMNDQGDREIGNVISGKRALIQRLGQNKGVMGIKRKTLNSRTVELVGQQNIFMREKQESSGETLKGHLLNVMDDIFLNYEHNELLLFAAEIKVRC